MALTVVHAKHSSIADDAAASAAGEVLPSDWNASHTVSGTLAAASVTGLATVATTGAYSDLSGTPTVPSAANPTASVGLAAVNGSASTFIRSDGAPPLDVTIAPTWSGLHTFSKNLTLSSGAALVSSGNISIAAWTTNGLRHQHAAASYTDTSSSGTVASAYTDLFGASTILASSATTYTSYYGSYFVAPVASTNVTMTNKSALGADSISIGGAAQSTFALAVTGTANISGAATLGGALTYGGVTLSNAVTGTGSMVLSAAPTFTGTANFGSAQVGASSFISWTIRGILSSPSAGSIQIGNTDVDTNASIVAQTLRSQGALAGGTADQAGKDWTFIASPGKGTGAGGSIIFKTTLAGTTGTSVNPATTGLTIKAGAAVLTSYTVANLPAAATAGAGATAFVTDASTTIILGIGTTVVGGGANKVPVYSDGTNWIIG